MIVNEGEVYVGRNPKYGDPMWGNPYSHKDNTSATYKVDTLEESLERYEKYLSANEYLLSRILELDGKVLRCHCTTKKCHKYIIQRVLNEQKILRA